MDVHHHSRRWNLLSAALLVVLAVAACTATQAPPPDGAAGSPPGFWMGLWHGIIAPVAFIVSLFADAVRIYAVPNGGLWYDFGFMLGIGGFSGGIFAGSRKG
jgi:hypothetical protein